MKNAVIRSLASEPTKLPLTAPDIAEPAAPSRPEPIINARGANMHDKFEGMFAMFRKMRVEVRAIHRETSGYVLELAGLGEEGFYRVNETVFDALALKKSIDIDPEEVWVLETKRDFSAIKLTLDTWALKEFGHKDRAVDLWRNEEDFQGREARSHLYFERAKFVQSIGLYDGGVLEDFEKGYLTSAPDNLRSADVMSWGDYIWYTRGTEMICRDIFDIAQRVPASPAQRIKIISYLADAGDYARAADQFRELVKLRPNIHLTNRYMGLSHFLYEEGLCDDPRTRADHDLLNKLRANDGSFEKMVRENSVAIVGSSPKQLGTGTGAQIDAHDFVVRFNQARPDFKFSEDYGSKFNVWVKSTANMFVKRQPFNPHIDLAIMVDGGFYKTKNLHLRFADMASEYKLQVIPSTVFFEVISKIQRQPSLGLLMIYWMSLLRGDMKDQHNIFGISLNDQGANKTVHYYELGKKISGHRHDWDAERRLFEEIVTT